MASAKPQSFRQRLSLAINRGARVTLHSPELIERDDGHQGFTVWFEGSIRKRHDPGEMSYRDLIKSLDQPVRHGETA